MTTTDKSRRVLLIGASRIGANMAGPAIRYVEFSRVLSKFFSVTLAIPPHAQAKSTPEEFAHEFEIALCKTKRQLKALAQTADVIVTLGANLSIYPFLAKANKPLAVDMYAPSILEGLQMHADRPIHDQRFLTDGYRGVHTEQIRAADFIVCASEKQRDFWLGWLSALGRVNPHTYRSDPTLTNMIGVVPFGLPSEAPAHNTRVMKGVHKTIGSDDKVILWGGGIWPWLDPFTLIRALSFISGPHPDIKLFFMGKGEPTNTQTGGIVDTTHEAIRLSQELGVYEKQVFFNDWVPYQERDNYLLESDLGVSLHLNHLETRFSFRTRFLDYIWAGLPILATEGDVISDQISQWEIGRVVKSGDAHQVGQALVELLETPDLKQCYKASFDRVRARYEWENVMAPLTDFCAAPHFAADKPHLKNIPHVERNVSTWYLLPGKAVRATRAYGLRGLGFKTKEFLQWTVEDGSQKARPSNDRLR
jgi:glycosyltransferase involved in cell wall biosynthesis